MNRRKILLLTTGIAIIGFLGAWRAYDAYDGNRARVATNDEFVRPHAPIVGAPSAPVTIVEFFDPACEACRAFYPIVKQILANHPNDARLVLRYATFHQGSDEAVRILEAARLQGQFIPVLEALLAAQPLWARHGNPDLQVAWTSASRAGLDLERARADMNRTEITEVLRQDAADVRSLNVTRTPTFFVNGKPLTSFGAQQLSDMVRAEVRAVVAARSSK